MARAAARSGPSTSWLEKGRKELLDLIFFICGKGCQRNRRSASRGSLVLWHHTHCQSETVASAGRPFTRPAPPPGGAGGRRPGAGGARSSHPLSLEKGITPCGRPAGKAPRSAAR